MQHNSGDIEESDSQLQKLQQQMLASTIVQSALSAAEQDLFARSPAGETQKQRRDIAQKVHKQLNHRLEQKKQETGKLSQLHQKSYTAIKTLLETTGEQQSAYREDQQALNECYAQMNAVQQDLHEKLNRLVTEQNMQRVTRSFKNSLITAGISSAARVFIDDAENILLTLQKRVSEHRKSIHSIYSRFQKHYGIGLIQPKPYSLQPRLDEFKNILDAARDYSDSMRIAASSRTALSQAFMTNVGTPAIQLFELIRQDINEWIENSLQPLSFQINDQRVMLDRKLDELQTATQSREQIEIHLKHLNNEQQQLEDGINLLHDYLQQA